MAHAALPFGRGEGLEGTVFVVGLVVGGWFVVARATRGSKSTGLRRTIHAPIGEVDHFPNQNATLLGLVHPPLLQQAPQRQARGRLSLSCCYFVCCCFFTYIGLALLGGVGTSRATLPVYPSFYRHYISLPSPPPGQLSTMSFDGPVGLGCGRRCRGRGGKGTHDDDDAAAKAALLPPPLSPPPPSTSMASPSSFSSSPFPLPVLLLVVVAASAWARCSSQRAWCCQSSSVFFFVCAKEEAEEEGGGGRGGGLRASSSSSSRLPGARGWKGLRSGCSEEEEACLSPWSCGWLLSFLVGGGTYSCSSSSDEWRVVLKE